MEMYEEIRAYHNQGRSIRWIAKRMRISRQTVKKYCKGEIIPGVRKEYHRESDVVTEDVKSFIEECFKSDEEEGLKKQQHTAKRIYDRLVEEKGFEGGESTIRKAVAELKDQNKIIANCLNDDLTAHRQSSVHCITSTKIGLSVWDAERKRNLSLNVIATILA